MAAMQEYKCPCCGGPIAFDSTLQKMKCPYCGTEFEMETLASYDEVLKEDIGDDMNWEQPTDEWSDSEAAGLNAYVCQSCRGEIMADENTVATSCPFCGNQVVMMGRVAGGLKPDLVLPFKLDKQAATAALKRHYSGKRLLPRAFMDENRIEEIKGVYVPFWLFDTEADAHIRYRATRLRTWSDSSFNYTETQYYSVARGGSLGFKEVPVDGSTKMADDLMESIEPFDFTQAVDFQTAYLAGYLADKYDVDSETCIPRANERIKQTTEAAFANTVQGYSSVTPEATSIQLKNGKVKYALLPVWLLNTTWNGKTYTFAMNGQTGRFVGDLPMDKGLYKKWLFGLTGGITAAIYAMFFLLWLL